MPGEDLSSFSEIVCSFLNRPKNLLLIQNQQVSEFAVTLYWCATTMQQFCNYSTGKISKVLWKYFFLFIRHPNYLLITSLKFKRVLLHLKCFFPY